MKRSIQWPALMAVLGFILGLGFLMPIQPTDSEIRGPANSSARTLDMTMLNPGLPLDETVKDSGRRGPVLFDVHTIARSKLARDTDAWVQATFVDERTRQELSGFRYCHNYDYDAQRANTSLDRYAVAPSPKRFRCYLIRVSDLPRGEDLILTPMGPVLSLRSNDFDPKRGGTLSLVFMYRVSLFGPNDYRTLDMKVRVERADVFVTGPRGESFDWLNLTMSEVLGLPNGVTSFDLYSHDHAVGSYLGKSFRRIKL